MWKSKYKIFKEKISRLFLNIKTSVEHGKIAKTKNCQKPHNFNTAKPHTKLTSGKIIKIDQNFFKFWYVCRPSKLHPKKCRKKWQAAILLHQMHAIIYALIPVYWTICSSMQVPWCHSCHASNEKFHCTSWKGRNGEQVGKFNELAAYLSDSMKHAKSIQYEVMTQEWLWQLMNVRISSEDNHAWGIQDHPSIRCLAS